MFKGLGRALLRGGACAAGGALAAGAVSSAAAQECAMTQALLLQQNSLTSNEMIRCLRGNAHFDKLAASEGAMIVARDQEDEDKLWKGIDISIRKGVLQRIPPPVVDKIDVMGKTPQEVARYIISQLPDTRNGAVVVLQGMSGTGKGTTTSTLLDLLPNSASWSNGNVFRSLTLLAATHCEQNGIDLKTQSEKVLTAENVATWMSMLSFVKVADKKYDIVIKGLGIDAKVSEIQNTVLKKPIVAKHIPIVAEQTQGDVVKFAAAALEQMAKDGMNVVLEGRAATVQYVPTPFRFELTLRDTDLLGQRRAAQRLMAECQQTFKDNQAATTADIVGRANALCAEWARSA